MSAARRCALLLGLAAACGGPAPPWPGPPAVPLDLQAHLLAEAAPLYGQVGLQLDLYRRRDIAVDFDPAIPDGFSGRVERLPPRPLGEGEWQRTLLWLSPERGPGKLPIPPFRARATDGTLAASTPELALEVTSLLASAGQGLEAAAPPFPPRLHLLPWLLGLGALLLVAAGFLTWRRRQRRRPAPLAIPVPAHVKALRELARLRNAARRTAAEVDAFYVATSQVLRVYLEERFGLRAPERTTEEFLQEVEGGGPLSAPQCQELRRFLDQCDLVKFAAQVPGEQVHQQTLAAAERLVEETRTDRAPMGVSA